MSASFVTNRLKNSLLENCQQQYVGFRKLKLNVFKSDHIIFQIKNQYNQE